MKTHQMNYTTFTKDHGTYSLTWLCYRGIPQCSFLTAHEAKLVAARLNTPAASV